MTADLERQLLELGRLIEYPRTPQLATLVRSRLPARSRRPMLTRWRAALVAVAAMLAIVVGVPPVRTAVAPPEGQIPGMRVWQCGQVPSGVRL